MAHILWPKRGEDFLPASLARVHFNNITVDLDTSKHYIQGQVHIKYTMHQNPVRSFLKLVLTEDVSDTKLSVFLINEFCELGQNVSVGDKMTLMGFKVNIETQSVPADYHSLSVLAMTNASRPVTIWIQVQGEDAPAAVDQSSNSALISTAQSPVSSNNTARVTSTSPAAKSKSRSVVHTSSQSTTHVAETTDKSPVSRSRRTLQVNAQSTAGADAAVVPSSSSNSNTRSPARKLQRLHAQYGYTAIKDVRPVTYVNVFGVVKYVRPASRGRGLDYSKMLSIIDESLTNPLHRLKCMLFAPELSLLPDATVGDVIRFHRLKISTFNNELQGQSGPGFSWALFDGSSDAVTAPKSTSSKNFTFTDNDIRRVTDLIDWTGSDNSLLSQDMPHSVADSAATLSSVTANMYFNLVCQVVAVCVLTEDKSILLRVWDGTKISIPTYQQNMSDEPDLINRLVTSRSLVRLSREYVVDLWVYDDHFAAAKPIKPGDFVSMTNVHAMIHKSTDEHPVNQSALMVELCIHGGGIEKYGRGLTIVDDSLPAVQHLKLVLNECADDCNNGSDEERPVADRVDARELDSGCLKRRLRSNKSSKSKNQKTSESHSGHTSATVSQPTEDNEAVVVSSSLTSDDDGHQSAESSSVTNQEDRCLLNTSTVIAADHHHIKRTCLRDVLAHELPYKFRVCANVIKYSPYAECPLDIIQLFCTACHFLAPVPHDISDDGTVTSNNSLAAHRHHVDNGVSMYTCPSCIPSTHPTTRQNVVCLSYIYMLSFVLDDGSGWLSAGLWKEEAVKFFHGIEPVELIRHKAKFIEVQQQLNDMCSEVTSGRRNMECCLMSFSAPCGRAYQIFDTELSLA